MNEPDRTFYTPTMARIQAEQGNLGRAATIYQYLLRRSPDRTDLAEDLDAVEARLAARDPYDLVEPVSRWAEAMLMLNRVAELTKIGRRLRNR